MSDPMVARSLDSPPPTLRQCHWIQATYEQQVQKHWETVYYGRLGVPGGALRLFLDCKGDDSTERALQRLRTLIVRLTAEPAAARLTVAQTLSAVVVGLVGSGRRIGTLFPPGAMRPFLDGEG